MFDAARVVIVPRRSKGNPSYILRQARIGRSERDFRNDAQIGGAASVILEMMRRSGAI
jgi:hypothetical protein